MKLSLVIPFIDNYDITKKCVETLAENAGQPFELLMVDNGSDKSYETQLNNVVKGRHIELSYIRNDKNLGVLTSFEQGFQLTGGRIIGFIHNDVLLHEENWVQKVIDAFEQKHIGLAGIFGAIGVGENGGRVRSQSNMLGREWGKCECHPVAWMHHSEHLEGIAPATILDGVGMFFSREAANSLLQTDMFADWRAPHHFYDRIMPLKLIDKSFRVATIGLGFDHWSGATANSSEKYQQSGKLWLEETGNYQEDVPIDKQIYDIAERQFFDEFGKRLPCYVDATWSYEWRGLA